MRPVLKTTLEIKSLGGDFTRWESSMIVERPRSVELRWGPPILGDTLQLELSRGGTVLATEEISLPTSLGWQGVHHFLFDLVPHITQPPQTDAVLYTLGAQAFKGGVAVGAANSVKIWYSKSDAETRFTEDGQYPEIYNPTLFDSKRYFVDFSRFRIERADEPGGDGDEPFYIPLVILFDGTTVLANSLPDSTVRVLNQGGSHGNVPSYGRPLTDGSEAVLGPDVGYYEFDLQPTGAREFTSLPPGVTGVPLSTLGAEMSDLLRGTFIWVAALALEEDSTLDHSIDAMREAVLGSIRQELNDCLQSLALPQLMTIAASPNPRAAVGALPCMTQEEYDELGLDTPFDEATYRDYLVAYLRSIGKDAALSEELDEARLWLPGGAIFQLIAFADHDEMIDFGDSMFSLRDLVFHGKPMRFELVLQSRAEVPPEVLAANPEALGEVLVDYRIIGTVGRCNENLPRMNNGRCAPWIHPSWNLGRPPYR